MPTVTLKAHFDGDRILLDEPYELPANTPLMVTVLPSPPQDDAESSLPLARVALTKAFCDDEPEYTTRDLHR